MNNLSMPALRPRTVVALAVYVLLVFLLVSKQQGATAYGLTIPIASADVISMVSALAPTIFFLAILIEQTLASRAAARVRWQSPSALAAAAIFLTIAVVGIRSDANVGELSSASAVAAWVGLFVDLLLIAGFAIFIRLIAPRWFLILPIAVAYYAFALWIGTKFDILPFIGFDTTPPVSISRFSMLPVGTVPAWVWRGYWVLILTALAATAGLARSLISRSNAGQANRRLVRGLAAVSIATLIALTVMLIWLVDERRALAIGYPDPTPPAAPFDMVLTRPRLIGFSIALDARDPADVRVRGMLQLKNMSGQDIPALLFEHAQMFETTSIHGSLRGNVWHSPDKRLLGLRLGRPLRPGETLNVDYAGYIRRRSVFDLTLASRASDNGIFLQTPAMMPLPRLSSCVVEHMPTTSCAAGENYLLGDAAHGQIQVLVPSALVVAGGELLSRNASFSRYAMHFDGRELSNLLVAAARYQVGLLREDPSCPAIATFTMAARQEGLRSLDAEICRARSHYAALFGRLERDSVRIVEVPDAVTEAMAYPDAIAVSERLLDPLTRNALGGLLRFVMWHETAHAWWGYKIVPAEGAGLGFALEAVPQFLALTNAAPNTSIEQTEGSLASSQNEAIGRFGIPANPIWAAPPDWQAYISAPLTLLRIDEAKAVEQSLARGFQQLAIRSRPFSGRDLALTVIANTDPRKKRKARALLGI